MAELEGMFPAEEVLETFDMISLSHLNVRTVVMPVGRFSSAKFVKRGGQIPSPLASLRD